MLIYRTHDMTNPEHSAEFFGTLALAHDAIKLLRPGARPEWRIDLFDVDTSKEGVLTLLNFGHDAQSLDPDKIQRSWYVTERGGLRETQPGE